MFFSMFECTCGVRVYMCICVFHNLKWNFSHR